MTKITRDLFGGKVIQKEKITRDKLKVILYNYFKDITIEEFAQIFTNPFHSIIEYVELQHGKKSGKRISLLFNPHRLETIGASGGISVYEAIKTEKYCDNLARAFLFVKKNRKVNFDIMLQETIRIGVAGVSYVFEFLPWVARDLATEFNLGKDSKVLDPCAGWGGRMLGFSVVIDDYEAFEPSTRTFNGLLELGKWIQNLNPTFNPKVHNLPFEDSNLKENYYDFALTSPPYYDTEKYSNEETNSWVRYKSFDDWCNGFYYPLIEKTMNALKPGSTFVLNIGSRVYPLNDRLISTFGNKYRITKDKKSSGRIGGDKSGLRGKTKEGEVFYFIQKI